MTASPLVVGLAGSAGHHSITSQLLAECLKLAEVHGARTKLFTGDELAGLPIFTTDDLRSSPVSEALIAAIRPADAVVFATPGYHGGMSGLLKNAIDYLELLRDDSRPYLDGRAVGVIVTAAGWQACGTTLVSVRSAIHALRGWPTPFGVTVNSVEQQFDDERVHGALEVLAKQLMLFTSWQSNAKAAGA